jgi:peptidoglycan/xylan/chitin deacetylase (PgdA/CDA1 family)
MEIASHTRTHASLSTIATSTMQTEILGSRNELLGMGATPVTSLIYPYGDYNDAVEAYAQSVGYLGARSVDRGYNDKTTDKFALKIQQVDINTTVDQIKAWIDTATANKTWLILMFHQVDTAGAELSMTPTNFQQVVDYLKTQNISVVTMQQGLSQM